MVGPFPAWAAKVAKCPVAAADLAVGDAAATAKLDAVVACLADRDSAERDDFALATLSAAMRSKDPNVRRMEPMLNDWLRALP